MVVVEQRTLICPVCGKGKFVDVFNSSGKNSVACSNCKQFIILDWDHMIATRGDKIKKVINR